LKYRREKENDSRSLKKEEKKTKKLQLANFFKYKQKKMQQRRQNF